MNITKIKFDGAQTIIHYSKEMEGGTTTKETMYKCDEERHPDFQAAMEGLVPLAISLLQLPMDYAEGVTIRGVSLSRNDHQGTGAVITMLKALPGINSPFTMNTPHVHNAEDGGSIMPTVMYTQIDTVIREATAFVVNRKRAQADLLEAVA